MSSFLQKLSRGFAPQVACYMLQATSEAYEFVMGDTLITFSNPRNIQITTHKASLENSEILDLKSFTITSIDS